MPMPWAYRHATKDFAAFLSDAKDGLDLTSDNAAYTAVDAVFQVFRRRLTVAQGLAFADVLPAVLRAMFVFRWDADAVPVAFAPRDVLTAEVQAIRPHHNLTPPNAIAAVARALRGHVNEADLDRVLAELPDGASDYWFVPEPDRLRRRIV